MQAWIIYALVAAVFAALVAVFGKLGVSKVDSTLATTVRALVSTTVLLVTSLLLGKFSLLNTIDSKSFKFIVLAGIAGAVSWIFYFLALKTGPASGVAGLDRLSLIFVLILGALFLSESITIKGVLGIILITAGTVLLILK